jgi:hypothetical protein
MNLEMLRDEYDLARRYTRLSALPSAIRVIFGVCLEVL